MTKEEVEKKAATVSVYAVGLGLVFLAERIGGVGCAGVALVLLWIAHSVNASRQRYKNTRLEK